jgi:hypothetical protein
MREIVNPFEEILPYHAGDGKIVQSRRNQI